MKFVETAWYKTQQNHHRSPRKQELRPYTHWILAGGGREVKDAAPDSWGIGHSASS